MPILNDETRAQVEQQLQHLPNLIRLVLFGVAGDPHVSDEVGELLDELAACGDRIEVEKHTFEATDERAVELGIVRAPAIAVLGERDYGIRYYGAPGGYEFASLIEVMADIGRGDVDLAAPLRADLAALTEPVHIQVFVTPT